MVRIEAPGGITPLISKVPLIRLFCVAFIGKIVELEFRINKNADIDREIRVSKERVIRRMCFRQGRG
jgi:hypothetical protein